MGDDIRPVFGDPTAGLVLEALDKADDLWIAQAGDIDTFACETWQNSGSGYQRVVAIQLQARRNHDHGRSATKTLTLLLGPDGAIGLAEQLAHTGRFLAATDQLGGGGRG